MNSKWRIDAIVTKSYAAAAFFAYAVLYSDALVGGRSVAACIASLPAARETLELHGNSSSAEDNKVGSENSEINRGIFHPAPPTRARINGLLHVEMRQKSVKREREGRTNNLYGPDMTYLRDDFPNNMGMENR